jgi:hypothetical protein
MSTYRIERVLAEQAPRETAWAVMEDGEAVDYRNTRQEARAVVASLQEAGTADPVTEWNDCKPTPEFDYETYFREREAEWEQEKTNCHALTLAHLQAGGIVREHGMGAPHDWRATGASTPEWIAQHLTCRRFGFYGITHERLPADAPAWIPPRPDGAHTVAELRELLKARGLTHVATFGGSLPLDEWKPYGEEVRWYGTLRDDGTVIDTPWREEGPEPSSSLVLGVWHFLAAV